MTNDMSYCNEVKLEEVCVSGWQRDGTLSVFHYTQTRRNQNRRSPQQQGDFMATTTVRKRVKED